MPPDDSRKDPRQKIADLIVRYGSATVEQFIDDHAQDVSKGGMFVRSPNPLAAGALVSFEIRIANEQSVVSGVGRVVWKRDAPQGERPAGMGVRFIDLDDASQATIERLLAAKTGPGSEFDQVPRPTSGAKTVLGLGSAFAVPPAPATQPGVQPPQSHQPAQEPARPAPASMSHDPSRKQTMLGMPAALRPEEAAARAAASPGERVGTHFGLAPPVSPASLVLAEQSSPAVRTTSTSDIDEGWLAEEVKTGKAKAAAQEATAEPAKPGAEAKVTVRMDPVTAPVRARAPEPAPEDAPAPAPVRQPSTPSSPPRAAAPRPSAAEAVDPPRSGSSAGWPWVLLLLLIAACGAVYYFRETLRSRGLLPTFLTALLFPAEPVPVAVPSASVAASASASASPVDGATDTDASDLDAAATEASVALGAGVDAGRDATTDAGRLDGGPTDAGHHDGSTKGGKPTPSASASAKPKPKPKPVDTP